MTQEDIINMAREAGLKHREAAEELYSPHSDGIYLDDLERFANLVAAAEREACEKVASDYADYQRSFGDEYAELRAMGALEVMDRISARGFRAFVRCFVGALEEMNRISARGNDD